MNKIGCGGNLSQSIQSKQSIKDRLFKTPNFLELVFNLYLITFIFYTFSLSNKNLEEEVTRIDSKIVLIQQQIDILNQQK